MRTGPTKKLQLNKHSLRNLTTRELELAAGGGKRETVALSVCRVCNTKRGC